MRSVGGWPAEGAWRTQHACELPWRDRVGLAGRRDVSVESDVVVTTCRRTGT